MPGSRFQRHPPSRPIGRRIIISCEGERTEYGYFQDIRKSLRMEPNKIIVVKPNGSDPLSVVREALDVRAEREQDRQWDADDEAWAAFDGDEHIANNAGNWHQALHLAQGNNVHLAISNPSFRYWYLLHFQNQAAYLTRQQAMRLLKTHLTDYEKSDVLYREELSARTADAIGRAKQVAHLAEARDAEAFANPCTHVWKLVELILSLQKEADR